MAEDNTYWVVVKHVRLLLYVTDEVVAGPFATMEEAYKAFRGYKEYPAWATTYSVEHRTK